MNCKRIAAMLVVVSLAVTCAVAVTGAAAAQAGSTVDKQTGVTRQALMLQQKHEAWKQMQDQEKTVNQQLSEKDLNRQFNDKIGSIKAELQHKFAIYAHADDRQQYKSVLAEMKSKQTERKAATQAIKLLKTEQSKLLARADLLEKQGYNEAAASVLDKLLQLEQQVIAAKQKLLQNK